MRFPPQFLDELRNRLSPSQVVGRYVKLHQKARGEYTGLCPFHNEKTPSFTVSDQKGFYHCFGCGAHGDVVKFVVEHTGESFADAVKRLAEEAGMQLPRPDPETERKYQKQAGLMDVMQMACEYFQKQLYSQAGMAARNYIKKRALSEETQALFRLGYAPDSRDGVKKYLIQKGVKEDQIVEAGLAIKPDNGKPSYDRFRGRLMFPICDARGRVIAFGGRILGDGEPKYLNSPETPLFHKGKVLYNWHLAKEAGFKEKQLVASEGYMDVIALYQAGFKHVVAPLGTAVTEMHVRMMWQVCDTPTMCLDGDNAGKRAMHRVANLALPLLQPGKSLKFAELPKGQDPDDLLKAKGQKAMAQVLEQSRPLVDVLWGMEQEGNDLRTPEQRAQFESDVMRQVERIVDESVKNYYKQDYKNRLYGLNRQSYFNAANQNNKSFKGNQNGEKRTAPIKMPAKLSEKEQCEACLLLAVIKHPGVLEYDEVGSVFYEMAFEGSSCSALFEATLECLDESAENMKEKLQQGLEKRGFTSHIEKLTQKVYFERFISETASLKLVIASWLYHYSKLQYAVMEHEYTEIANNTSQQHQNFERLWELKQQKDALRATVELQKQEFEDVLELELEHS